MTSLQAPEIPHRPTVMEVDLEALKHNFRQLASHASPARVMAVVKANAYGHGLIPCARALVEAGAPSLGVAFVEEGLELRKAGIQIPILVFGGIFGEQIALFIAHDLDVTASSISKLEAIDRVAASLGKRAKVHLKIDTGLERIGVHHYTAAGFFEATRRCKSVDIVGIFSHLATADDKDTSFMGLQVQRFREVCSQFKAPSGAQPILHIANSAATLQSRESHFDLVRPGLALYGAPPSSHLAHILPLRPVMQLKSRVVYFKVVKKGSTVGYGRTWTAPEDCRVVTIPVGYGDGYSRALSNKAHVLIRGRRYPIIGRVNMDQIMVNIGRDSAYNGDEVVLIGSQDGETITVDEIARHAGTIPWEIFTAINTRVPRRFVG